MRKSRRTMNTKRALLLVTALILFGGLTYGANKYQVRRNADQMLEQARTAREDQNRGDALMLYETYLNFQPKDMDALGEYASVLEGDQNPKAKRALLDVYERMMLNAPHRAEERKKLVQLYLNYQVYSSAKHHLTRLLDPVGGVPDDVAALEQLASCEFRLGQQAEGIAILKRLIATKKASPDVYRRLAEVVRKENKPTSGEEADRIIEQMAKDLTDDIAARVIRINHLFAKGLPDEARKEILTAAREAKDTEKNAEFSLLLADYYTHQKQYTSAREVLSRAIGENPNNPRLRAAYYQTLELLKDSAKSQEELKKATQLAANNDPHTIELLDLIIENRELELARREVDRRYKNKEAYRPVYDYLTGRLSLAEGNWPEALPALSRCLEFFERFPLHYAKAQLSVAQCQTLANNPERTLEAYTKAVIANPRLVQAQLGKAESLLRLNRLRDAEPILREYADTIPAARLALANAKFLEQLTRPANKRSWAEFDASLGMPPYSVGVEIVRAQALAAQNKADEAEKLLKDLVVRVGDSPAARVALADIVARRGVKESLDVVDAGEKQLGDKIAFRIARANLLARSTRDAKAIRTLADNATKFPAAEQQELALAIANVLTQLGQPEAAIDLVKPIAAARPFDLPSRMTLTQLYLQTKRLAEADAVISELQKLDGEQGPIYLFAQVMSDLAKTTKLDKEQAERMRGRLEAIVKRRETWTRPYALLGDIGLFTNDTEAALQNYRRAYDLGDRDEAMLRKYLDLLLARSRQEEARRILDERERVVGLPKDLRQTLSLLEAAAGQGGDRSRAIVQQTEDSTDPKEQLFRGNWFLLNGNTADAGKAFTKATQHGPHLAETWVSLVQLQVARGDMPAAKQTVAKVGPALLTAGDKVANKTIIPQAVGQCQELIGEFAAAERTYLTGLQSYPADNMLQTALGELYRKLGRHADANARWDAILASTAPDDLKRLARRNIATAKLVGSGAHTRIDAALALLDENLKSGEHAQDLRTKAFILARDPFRRVEAHQLLEKAASREPFPPDDAAQRATLYLQEGRLQLAENDLRDATKSPTARPAHLLLLHQVQLKANRLDAARATLDRIKSALPQSWDATAAEARQVAKQSDKSRAAAIVQTAAQAGNDEFRLQVAGPLLIELGCTADAENLYAKSPSPRRFFGLVQVYLAADQHVKAIQTAWKLEPIDASATLTRVNLLKTAIATKHRAAVPAGDLPEWDRIVGEAAAWVSDLAKKNPKELAFTAADAAILDSLGKYDEAIAAYERMLALDDKQIVALNNLASLLVLHKKETGPRPLELVNKAIELLGPQGSLLDTRAMIQTHLGKPTEALADLTVARVTEPRAVYDYHAAAAADKARDGEQKRNWIDKAREKGLKKTMLHPLEWPTHERLFGPE